MRDQGLSRARRKQSETWPEARERTFQWVEPEKAIALVREPELKALIAAFARRAAVAASKMML